MRGLPFNTGFFTNGAVMALICAIGGSLAACQDGASAPKPEPASQPLSSAASPGLTDIECPVFDDRLCRDEDRLPTRIPWDPQLRVPPVRAADARVVIVPHPRTSKLRWAFFREQGRIRYWFELETGNLGQLFLALESAPRRVPQDPKEPKQLKAAAVADTGWETSTDNLQMLPDCPLPPPVGPGAKADGKDEGLERAVVQWQVSKLLHSMALLDELNNVASDRATKCIDACPVPNPNPIPVLQ